MKSLSPKHATIANVYNYYTQGGPQEAWTNKKFKWLCEECARDEQNAHGMKEGVCAEKQLEEVGE